MAALTQARVRELFTYDAETGVLRWRVRKAYRVRVGDRAGYLSREGYWCVTIDNGTHKVHRVIWLYVHGAFTKCDIDHINRDRSDNRLCNLREASFAENRRNVGAYATNKAGHKGVVRRPNGRWQAYINADCRRVHLGTFDTVDQAAMAYRTAAARLHGEYARVA